MPLPTDRIILPGGVPTGREILPEHEENPPDSGQTVELDEFTKRVLGDIWDRLKYAETKITRDKVTHYITKVEKLVADHRVTITYKRDSEHYITEQKVRVKMTTEFE